MKRFKHILATTDLSPESYAAVLYAAHLAEGQGARLTVLHVPHSVSLAYTDFTPPVSMAEIDAAIEKAASDELASWVETHLARVPRTKVLMRRGITHEVVCQVAEEIGASVIVIATHGRRGLGKVVLGSVTDSVIRHAPCPVLVVRPPKEAGGGRKPKPKAKSQKKAAKAK